MCPYLWDIAKIGGNFKTKEKLNNYLPFISVNTYSEIKIIIIISRAWRLIPSRHKQILATLRRGFLIYAHAIPTWNAKSWYFCFSLGPRAYHHSPKIFDTVRLSWLGWRWCTKARCRFEKIMNAFIGRLMWSPLSFPWKIFKKKKKEDMLVVYIFFKMGGEILTLSVCVHGCLCIYYYPSWNLPRNQPGARGYNWGGVCSNHCFNLNSIFVLTQ